MNKRILRAFVATGALATACASWGCVADRPSRNGVFNENQYIRKDFLIRSASGGTDPGWFMKETLVSSSTPNPYFAQGLFNGQDAVGSGGPTGFFAYYVRWAITSDKLQLVNMRELSGDPNIAAQGTRDPEIINAWPATNVDLKYEINLDGEITNFFQENQEADWQQRQWIKINFDKNDLSDLAPLGEAAVAYLEQCGDVNTSTTLVPGSFLVDEPNNYMQFQLQTTVPVNVSDPTCLSSYGTLGSEFMNFGRQNVTMTIMYSFVRAASDSGIWDPTPVSEGGRGCTDNGELVCPATTYVPLSVSEKDPIQHKYGAWQGISMNRDQATGLLTATQLVTRLNPNLKTTDGPKGVPTYTIYLSEGFPTQYEQIFCGYGPGPGLGQPEATGKNCGVAGTGGLIDQMNTVWRNAGADLQMRVMHYDDLTTFSDHLNKNNPKQFGDVRYSFFRFLSDLDVGNQFLGVTQPLGDPRTGEIIVNTIEMQNENFEDAYVSKLEFYLETIGGQGPSQKDNPMAIANNAFANPGPSTCTTQTLGDSIPLSNNPNGAPDNSMGGAVQTNQNAISTVFQKMQQYLHKPIPTYGYLGPDDFIPQEDSDFFDAFFKIIPYEVFRDPMTNPFVIEEGGTGNYSSSAMQLQARQNIATFNSFMSNIDHGYPPMVDIGNGMEPYDPLSPDGPKQAAAFTAQWQQVSTNYNQTQYIQNRPNMDKPAEILGYFDYLELNLRHCVVSQANPKPHWETLPEWVQNMVTSIWSATVWHEFGHSMGLRHNFMASLDRNNFPMWTDGKGQQHVGMYANSIMEYTVRAGDLFFRGGASPSTTPGAPKVLNADWNGRPGWLPYDVAALSWIYGNNLSKTDQGPKGGPGTSYIAAATGESHISGQTSATTPWKDPMGWSSQNCPNGEKTCEDAYLFCTDEHIQYSPFCKQFDFGTTPSEIIAASLNQEEWFYKWTNFRLYHKYWDDSGYAGGRATFYHDILRFLSTWSYDWSQGELPGIFVKLGIKPPNKSVPEASYYANLVNSFENDISVANQLSAAFHLAMVEQASGERPFITTFDPYYGDVTQQGIIIDKNYALQNFTTLYPVDNYDPTQAAGAYLFAAGNFDSNYQSVAQNAVNQFVGGQYDVFLYDVPLAVQNFAMTTQNPYFGGSGGQTSIRDWIGAKVFGGGILDPNEGYLDWAANLAAQEGFGCDATGYNCGNLGTPGIIPCTSTLSGLAGCTWDPRMPQLTPDDIYHSDPFNEFRGPDNRRYAWCPISDRNQLMLVDRDWNTATYVIVRNWNSDVTYNLDDGSGGNFAYQLELPLKYFLNAYQAYN
jgi:hypothetical protein